MLRWILRLYFTPYLKQNHIEALEVHLSSNLCKCKYDIWFITCVITYFLVKPSKRPTIRTWKGCRVKPLKMWTSFVANAVITDTSHVLGTVPIQALKLTSWWGCLKPDHATASVVLSIVKSISPLSLKEKGKHFDYLLHNFQNGFQRRKS